MVIVLTDVNFSAEVVQSKKPFLVAFTSAKCGPCKAVDPVLEKLAEGGVVRVGKIDISRYPKLAKKYVLGSLPTLLLFSRGIINQYVGKPSLEALNKFIAIHA